MVFGNDDPLKILKVRYAKGEITKEEYLEMKKDLEEDFTPNKGKKNNTQHEEVEIEEEEKPKFSKKYLCDCGEENEWEAVFCANCGKKLRPDRKK